MFSLAIVDSDAFLDLPAKAQLLYFHLGMRADDEGLIDNVRKILAITGIGEADLRTLLDAGYVISFGTGVYAPRHWKSNNLIQKDRFRPSSHRREREMLEIDRGGCYQVRPECLEAVSSAVSKAGNGDVSKDVPEDKTENGMVSNVMKDSEDVFELLPLLKGGKAAVTEEYVERLESLYPAVDVRSEVRKAIAWLEANPKNRKTQWKRFLNNWLSRRQDSAPRKDAEPSARLKALETVHPDRIDSGRYGDVDVMDFSDPGFDYEGYCERNGFGEEEKDD